MNDAIWLSPAEAFAKMKDEGFSYVDVRTEDEFAEGRPKGAVNVSLAPEEGFVGAMEKVFAKDAPLIVGCKMGGRSARAAQLLTGAGFTRVFDQHAGWDGTRGPFGELVVPGWSRTDLPRDP